MAGVTAVANAWKGLVRRSAESLVMIGSRQYRRCLKEWHGFENRDMLDTGCEQQLPQGNRSQYFKGICAVLERAGDVPSAFKEPSLLEVRERSRQPVVNGL